MYLVWVIFFCSIFNFFIYFNKKLLALLFLELCFLSMIFMYYFYFLSSVGMSSFFPMMIFLSFMVLDSVLGLCLLCVSSRGSCSFSDSFFCI